MKSMKTSLKHINLKIRAKALLNQTFTNPRLKSGVSIQNNNEHNNLIRAYQT